SEKHTGLDRREARRRDRADGGAAERVGPPISFRYATMRDMATTLSRRELARFLGAGVAVAGLRPAAAGAPQRPPAIEPVRLSAKFAHDLERMAVDGAGLIYVCNPNNPTASLTPRGPLRTFVDASRAPVLVDEAYHHYADAPEYESLIPLVASHPNLIV